MAKAKKQPQTQSKSKLNDPVERKRFKTGLATVTHHFQAIDNEKEAIKEVIEELAEQAGLDKKTVRKLAVTMYKHNYASLQEENQHFSLLYETIIEGRLTAVADPLDRKGKDEDADDVDGLTQDEEKKEKEKKAA